MINSRWFQHTAQCEFKISPKKGHLKPKNQKRCWYNIGSPPPAASKNDVLKLRSVNTIVIAPANTGNDNNNNTAVTTTAQPNKASLCRLIPGLLILNIVVIKLIAPSNELTPDKCKPKIAKSTLGPLWLCIPDKGGYNVQPVPAPFSIVLAKMNKIRLGGSSQKEMLFSLGNLNSIQNKTCFDIHKKVFLWR